MFGSAASKISLHKAAKKGVLDLLKLHIESGTEVNLRNGKGSTPLMLAAKNGHAPAVSYLLEHGADCNASDDWGVTALMLAASCGQVEIMECLLNIGAAIDQTDNHGDTALLWAAKYNQRVAISLLLTGGADLKVKNNMGENALLKSIPYEDCALMFISAGCEVNESNASNVTPLIKALVHKNQALAEILLNAGADVSVKEEEPSIPLLLATEHGFEAMIERIASNAKINKMAMPYQTALKYAVIHNDLAVVKTLISAGADITVTSGWDKYGGGYSPIMLAARVGHLEVFNLLLAESAKHGFNNMRSHALHAAIAGGQTAIVNVLMNVGTNVNLPLYNLPLVAAAKGGYPDIVKMLLIAGARRSFLRKGWQQVRPLQEAVCAAVKVGHKEIVEILLAAGSECFPELKFVAFEEAVISGQTEIVGLLLATGFEGDDRFDAWDAAINRGHIELIRFLLAKLGETADINMLLASAVRSHQKEIFELLWGMGRATADINELLREAARSDYKEMVVFLLTQGADIHAFGIGPHYKHNALMSAVIDGFIFRRNETEIVKLLLDSGTDVNARTATGETALMLSIGVSDSSKAIVAQLLDAGAEVDAINQEGRTALMLLMMKPYWECKGKSCYCLVPERQEKAKLLFAHGADLYHKDNEGKTAIDYAHRSPMLQRWLIHEYAWHRRRHAICFYARRHHIAETAMSASL